MITVGVDSVRGEKFICSCIYASNSRNDRSTIWEENRQVRNIIGENNHPWILIVDFNVTLRWDKHSRVMYGLGDQHGMLEFRYVGVSSIGL